MTNDKAYSIFKLLHKIISIIIIFCIGFILGNSTEERYSYIKATALILIGCALAKGILGIISNSFQNHVQCKN
jgi:D-alanyl-lipoteichoic acid acyltransferase DltB (MBOAT superfamily)